MTTDRMNLKELAPPSSATSTSHTTTETPETPLHRSASTSKNAKYEPNSKSHPNDIAANAASTTTFVLSDDANTLNGDLARSALNDASSSASASAVPTQVRGNRNPHHTAVHSVTKVKNINLIHLGRYFIKPWYFSPYPEVK